MTPAALHEPASAVLLGGGTALATASLTGDQLDTIKLVVGAVAAVVGATVGAIAWHRRETRAAIRAHEKVEQANDDRRHQEVMDRLTMLIQRLVDLKVIPEHSPSGTWLLQPAPRRDDDTGGG